MGTSKGGEALVVVNEERCPWDVASDVDKPCEIHHTRVAERLERSEQRILHHRSRAACDSGWRIPHLRFALLCSKCLRSVVLPAPRNPVTSSTGTLVGPPLSPSILFSKFTHLRRHMHSPALHGDDDVPTRCVQSRVCAGTDQNLNGNSSKGSIWQTDA